ncbi:TIGR04255 family protein [Maribacter stanieri]|uniref:TIGR04255 family protein n=1 Tax=Maribacter stanieri TaxID=440514 RepID=UPI002494344C|nr:TIGR04255 family protein [Maribacter stanieri]
MEVSNTYYENAPIILSIIQYRYDKIEKFDINLVKELAKKFKSKYPIVNERFVQSIVVNNDNNETNVSLEDKQFDGIQVMSKNRKEYFTITETKFTYQSHEKYEGWENFITNAIEFWDDFSTSFDIKELNGVSLRYVNKIKLPLDIRDITKYFTTYLKDDKNTFSIGNFQFRFSSFDKENNFRINISHLLDTPVEEFVPYIFDIDVLHNNKVENTKEITLGLFEKIRTKKNQIFNDGITVETKKLIH